MAPDEGSGRFTVFDRHRSQCSPTNEPLDAGQWSVSPVLRERSQLRVGRTRYFFDKQSSFLQQIHSTEEHVVSMDLDKGDPELDALVVAGEQELVLIPRGHSRTAVLDNLGKRLTPHPTGPLNTVSEFTL